jgi:hypothetical protein
MVIIYWMLLLVSAAIGLVVGGYFCAELVALIRNGGVPYVPLKPRQIRAVLDRVPVTGADVVLDLGCGDGRILRAFLQAGAGTARGYEINVAANLIGRWKSWRMNVHPTILGKNFFNESISDATIVFVYLLPKTLQQLKGKLDRELKPGTKVVSFGFSIDNWRTPTAALQTNPEHPTLNRLYIYTIN